jgi:hypothetical protein
LCPEKETSYLSSRAQSSVASNIHTFADATQNAKPISLYKSSTGVEVPHLVDNVLARKFWNKAWLEQNLEQEKPCRIK